MAFESLVAAGIALWLVRALPLKKTYFYVGILLVLHIASLALSLFVWQ